MITIDAEVFGEDEKHAISWETFAVSGDCDPTTLMEALDEVAYRFMLVDPAGTEHDDPDEMETQGVKPAPRYVSTPKEVGGDIQVYVDCQGHIEDEVATAFRQILTEELESLDVDLRVTVVKYAKD